MTIIHKLLQTTVCRAPGSSNILLKSQAWQRWMTESEGADFCGTVSSDMSGLGAAVDRKRFFLVYCCVTASPRSSFSKLRHTICHSSHTSSPSLLLSPPLAYSSPLLTVFLISALQTAPPLQSASALTHKHAHTHTHPGFQLLDLMHAL